MARPANGTQMNIAELQRILNERQREVDRMARRREKLQQQIDAIDAEIEKLSGGEAAGGGNDGGGRAKNTRPLPEYIEEALSKNGGKPMRVGEIVEAVQSAGYRSNSRSFKNIVNQQLIKERKRFQQIDRGVYGLAKK